jgi:RNA polymerase sigma-70 factor (ECF subfamily)
VQAVTTQRPLDSAALIRTHQAGIWRYLRYLGAEPSVAEDLTQETFLAVLRRPFEQVSTVATAAYLRQVARNLFLKALRRARSRPGEVELEAVELEAAERVYMELAGSDGGAGYLDALRHCLQGLTGRVREVLDRFYRQDSSREQLAQAMAMSEDGIKSLMRRARETLRACIERRIAG